MGSSQFPATKGRSDASAFSDTPEGLKKRATEFIKSKDRIERYVKELDTIFSGVSLLRDRIGPLVAEISEHKAKRTMPADYAGMQATLAQNTSLVSDALEKIAERMNYLIGFQELFETDKGKLISKNYTLAQELLEQSNSHIYVLNKLPVLNELNGQLEVLRQLMEGYPKNTIPDSTNLSPEIKEIFGMLHITLKLAKAYDAEINVYSYRTAKSTYEEMATKLDALDNSLSECQSKLTAFFTSNGINLSDPELQKTSAQIMGLKSEVALKSKELRRKSKIAINAKRATEQVTVEGDAASPAKKEKQLQKPKREIEWKMWICGSLVAISLWGAYTGALVWAGASLSASIFFGFLGTAATFIVGISRL